MNSRAFTMAEILVTTVVMGVIAGMAVPAYVNMMEQARAEEAKTNLAIILLAEKTYRINSPTGNYWCGGNLGNGNAPRVSINANLKTDINPANWQYYTDNVRIDCGGGDVGIRLERTGGGTAHYFCLKKWVGGVYSIRDRGANSNCNA